MIMKQDPPNAIQIELTEGCCLSCSFCGINGIREKPGLYNYMTVDLAHDIASLIKEAEWTSRIEFAMHGEPSLNRDVYEIVRTIRDILPKNSLMMTSNGAGFVKEPQLIDDLFSAGLNILMLDNYESVKFVPKILESYKGDVQILNYPDDPDANPHRRMKPYEHVIIVTQDISKASTGTHSHLCNHAGAAAPRNDKGAGKRCAKPFRELSIRWDGNVACCCNSWRGVYKIGNISNYETLEDLWNSQRFYALRQKLYYGQRDFGDCNGCDAISYRVGLLPDKLGKESLPEPDETTNNIIKEACAGDPYTLPVLRPWELK